MELFSFTQPYVLPWSPFASDAFAKKWRLYFIEKSCANILMSSHLQQLKLGHLSTDIAASYGADPLETF